LLEQVVAIKEKMLAKDYFFRLASQHAFAEAYKTNEQIKEAIKLFEQIVVIEEKMLAI
jgi:hypothetical protein